jgi:hypothetical protein
MAVKLLITGDDYDQIIDTVLTHGELNYDNVFEAANQYVCFMYFPSVDYIINTNPQVSTWDADNQQIIAELIGP